MANSGKFKKKCGTDFCHNKWNVTSDESIPVRRRIHTQALEVLDKIHKDDFYSTSVSYCKGCIEHVTQTCTECNRPKAIDPHTDANTQTAKDSIIDASTQTSPTSINVKGMYLLTVTYPQKDLSNHNYETTLLVCNTWAFSDGTYYSTSWYVQRYSDQN